MSENNKKETGIYFSLLVCENDAKKLHDFGDDILGLDMKNSGCFHESRKHATLLASHTKDHPTEHYKQFVEQEKVIEVHPVKWKLLKSPQTGKTCLALVIKSNDLVDFHDELKSKTGLSHAFDDFLTHISFHYDYKGNEESLKDLPLPKFPIKLEKMYSKPYYSLANGTKPLKPEDNNERTQQQFKNSVLENMKKIRSASLESLSQTSPTIKKK